MIRLELTQEEIDAIIYHIASKFVAPSNKKLHSLCMEHGYNGLVSFFKYYSPDKGATQKTFLYTCVSDEIKTAINSIYEECNVMNENDEIGEFAFGKCDENHEENLDKENLIDNCIELLQKKNPLWYGIFIFHHTQDKTFKNIGVIFGCSATYIDQEDKKMLEYLRKFLDF